MSQVPKLVSGRAGVKTQLFISLVHASIISNQDRDLGILTVPPETKEVDVSAQKPSVKATTP